MKNRKTKIGLSIFALLVVFSLFGLGDKTVTGTFVNYDDVSYTAKSYFHIIESNIKVNDVYYMPEIGHICIDLDVKKGINTNYYEVTFKHDEGHLHYSDSRNSLGKVTSDGSYLLCYDNLKYSSYDIIINRINRMGDGRKILAKISYKDDSFYGRKDIVTGLVIDETSTVDLYGNPSVSFTLKVNNDFDNSRGNFILSIYDQIPIYENQLTNDDFDISGTYGVINNFVFDQLTPNYTYNLQLLYKPFFDMEFPIQIRNINVNSSSMVGLEQECYRHFLCAEIVSVEFAEDLAIYNIFVVNDPMFINEGTLEGHKLKFNVYNSSNVLVYSLPLVDNQQQVEVPKEFVILYGRIEIETDIQLYEEVDDIFKVLDTIHFRNGIIQE